MKEIMQIQFRLEKNGTSKITVAISLQLAPTSIYVFMPCKSCTEHGEK